MGKQSKHIQQKQSRLFSDSESDNQSDSEVPQLIPAPVVSKNKLTKSKVPQVSQNIKAKPAAVNKNYKVEESDMEDDDDQSHSYEEVDSDKEIAQAFNGDMSDQEQPFDQEKNKLFAQRGINNEEMMLKRLSEMRANFYNRLESKRIIKKQGRIPFTEHMTITNDEVMKVPEALTVHDDIKREMAFRPDDFFAEMLKTDHHMSKVKSKLLQQQHKIENFEERKQKMENKKFHKAIKAYKQDVKHKEKRQNLENITKLKKEIREKGGDTDEKDFNKLFNGGVNKDIKKGQKQRVFDAIRSKSSDSSKKESQGRNKKSKGISKNQKRPGKVNRSKHKPRNKKAK